MDESTSGTVRLIKVGRTTQVRRAGGKNSVVVVPYIRLSGKWLERAGFLEGDIIKVTAVDGEIKIVRQREQGMPGWGQGELF